MGSRVGRGVVGTWGSVGLGVVGSRVVARSVGLGVGSCDKVGGFVNILIEAAVGTDVVATMVGDDVVGSLVAEIGLRVGNDAVGAADGASLPISVEVDEELNVGEEEDVVLTVGGDEDDRLTVGRELDVGIEEEADPLPDTVGMLENNDGTKEDCPPPEVNEVGATEGDDIASAVAFVVEGEGEYVTDPPEDEKLGDGEEEIVVPLEIPRVELNAVGGIVGT